MNFHTLETTIPMNENEELIYIGFLGYDDFATNTGEINAEALLGFVEFGSSSINSPTVFTYDRTNGDLFYSGSFNFGGPVKITTLQGAPNLSANDIMPDIR
jgi:hypothetical protein